MSSLAKLLGSSIESHPRRNLFLKWQCHIRQMSIRQMDGRPDNAIMPTLKFTKFIIQEVPHMRLEEYSKVFDNSNWIPHWHI